MQLTTQVETVQPSLSGEDNNHPANVNRHPANVVNDETKRETSKKSHCPACSQLAG
jgi:hypothetical protein